MTIKLISFSTVNRTLVSRLKIAAPNKLSDPPQGIENLLLCANCSFLNYYNRFFISFELITLNCVVDKLTVYWCVWLWKVFATLKKNMSCNGSYISFFPTKISILFSLLKWIIWLKWIIRSYPIVRDK